MHPLRPGSGGSGGGAASAAEERRRASSSRAGTAAAGAADGSGGGDGFGQGEPRTFRAKELTTEARTEADWLSKADPEERVVLELDPRRFMARPGRPRKGGGWCFDLGQAA